MAGDPIPPMNYWGTATTATSNDYIYLDWGTSGIAKKVTWDEVWKSQQIKTDALVDMESIIMAVKKELQPERVIHPCQYCGQWGALDIPCRKCGAPIK